METLSRALSKLAKPVSREQALLLPRAGPASSSPLHTAHPEASVA